VQARTLVAREPERLFEPRLRDVVAAAKRFVDRLDGQRDRAAASFLIGERVDRAADDVGAAVRVELEAVLAQDAGDVAARTRRDVRLQRVGDAACSFERPGGNDPARLHDVRGARSAPREGFRPDAFVARRECIPGDGVRERLLHQHVGDGRRLEIGQRGEREQQPIRDGGDAPFRIGSPALRDDGSDVPVVADACGVDRRRIHVQEAGQRRHVGRIEAERVVADGRGHPAGEPAWNRKRRRRAKSDHPAHVGRRCVDQAREEVKRFVVVDAVQVVDHDRHRFGHHFGEPQREQLRHVPVPPRARVGRGKVSEGRGNDRFERPRERARQRRDPAMFGSHAEHRDVAERSGEALRDRRRFAAPGGTGDEGDAAPPGEHESAQDGRPHHRAPARERVSCRRLGRHSGRRSRPDRCSRVRRSRNTARGRSRCCRT
jgi:hypothetical protein